MSSSSDSSVPEHDRDAGGAAGAPEEASISTEGPLPPQQRMAMALMIATPFALVGLVYLALR